MSRSDQEIVTALKQQKAFSECSQVDLDDLAKHVNHTSVPKGWALIQQQTPSDAVYVILSGDADVIVKDKKVASITAGAVVGEAGVAGHKLRNATVLSTSPLDLLHINADDFTDLLKRRPSLEDVFLARTKEAAKATADA
jgi:CRP/FNR family cyclic AMP-dependent transcriptional regulator